MKDRSPAVRPPNGALCLALCLTFCGAATAGTISSLSVERRLDNGNAPSVVVAGASDSVAVAYAGEWFASGTCDLYVDGVRVGRSSGEPATYALAGTSDAYRSYRLTLVAGDEKMTKTVTLFPYAGYSCALHSLTLSGGFLDSRPAGTVRKLKSGGTMPVAWSGLWNAGADRAVVTLYSGTGAGGTCLGELVSEGESGEGTYVLSPSAHSLDAGPYTLTHFDGVETLFAGFRISGGTIVIIR